MKSAFKNGDVWDDEPLGVEGDEGRSQVPKVTKEFKNTLIGNKGKLSGKDLREILDVGKKDREGGCSGEKRSLKSGCANSQFKFRHFGNCKPKSQKYAAGIKSGFSSLSLAKKHTSDLRRVPSCDILKSLRS
ncbi:unnamed protein product [Moneuplotes crassus]|uniref:Uncharacterized protein n=1 Tax=Euplotes crassus TaxID=5936 RepID=A0AAD1XY51_EUPCR|nr:unnamed protein product [Moneuplotes crassus]